MKVEEPFDPELISVEQLQERIRDIREEAYQLRKLGENAAWSAFEAAVKANAETVRKSKTTRILGTSDDSLTHNYFCGFADGLDRAASLRAEIVEEIEQVLKELNELLKEKENAQTATSTDESERAGSDTTGELFGDTGGYTNGDASSEQFAP